VPFAFACRVVGTPLRRVAKACFRGRSSTVVTLGCAILLGGYWAYVTLGWGGYWGLGPGRERLAGALDSSAALVHGMICSGTRALPQAQLLPRNPGLRAGRLRHVPDPQECWPTSRSTSFVDLGITGWLVGNLAGAMVLGFGHCYGAGARSPPNRVTSRLLAHRVLRRRDRRAARHGGEPCSSAPLRRSSPAWRRRLRRLGRPSTTASSLPIGIVLATLLGTVPFLQ